VSEPLLDDLLELAAIPAPTFAEDARVAWLERRLADEPGTRARDSVGNLIWSWGEGTIGLLVLAHVDTVFPADVPLEFTRNGARIVGPGIGDNAAAVAAVVHAVSSLLARDVPASAGAVAFTVGEEGLGDLRGARAACEALRPQAAIAVEGHGLDEVVVDAVGSVRARVRVEGPGGHSWADRGRPSALHALLQIGTELLELSTEDTPVNVGLVSGGQSINSIAGEAVLVVELRALDEEPLLRFEQALASLEVQPPLSLSVQPVGRRPAGRLDRTAPLLGLVRSACQALDLPDRLGAGSTDANAALARGIPALTLGVARGGGMHTREEWIDADSLSVGVRLLETVLAAALDGRDDRR
jgi:acetylornithine deacetylase/succinyl-diaminopimelate desuccinylase-like protein